MPLDTKNTVLDTHAWRVWQGLEKNQIEDFENCFAQKFPGKVDCSFDNSSWIFSLTLPINMTLWKKFRKKCLWTPRKRFWQPMLEESGKDWKKTKTTTSRIVLPKKFLAKVECSFYKTSRIFSFTVSINMILWKNSTKSASGHVEDSFGNPCLKNLARTRNKTKSTTSRTVLLKKSPEK